MKKNGQVYWITGLSGAGKTTIAKELYNRIKIVKENVIFLDGDILRDVFGNDLGYSLSDRKKSAMRNSKLCKLLSNQGIDVVIATISMFDECREWNRKNIKNYNEIYLKVPIEILVKRNQKQLYSNALDGKEENVLGINLDFEEPKNPNVIINNDGSKSIDEILKKLTKIIRKNEGGRIR